MKFYGCILRGMRPELVAVQCQLDRGAAGALFLGLAQSVVKEGWTRARKAIESSSFYPIGRIGLSFDLVPCALPKNDPTLDLCLAVTSLVARAAHPIPEPPEPPEDASDELWDEYRDRLAKWKRAQIEASKIVEIATKSDASVLLVGNLDPATGGLRRDRGGVLSRLFALHRRQLAGNWMVVVPEESQAEVSLVLAGINARVFIAADLREVFEVLFMGASPRVPSRPTRRQLTTGGDEFPDLKSFEGLATAREAVEIAAAGGHHILLYGSAGMGKTKLALAMAGLLPRLGEEDLFEVNKIWDALGELPEGSLRYQRPVVEVSQAVTKVQLLGGGRDYPVPGMISKAHLGILLVNEFNELDRSMLDELRDPLQDGAFSITRGHASEKFPCRFQLVATMNPCPCGRWGEFECTKCRSALDTDWCPACLTSKHVVHLCQCRASDIERCRRAISGPIVDRIDLRVRISSSDLERLSRPRSTSTAQRAIKAAIRRQDNRYAGMKIRRNGELSTLLYADIEALLAREGLSKAVAAVVEDHRRALHAAMRFKAKLISVARTYADLEEAGPLSRAHVEQAVEIMGARDPYWRAEGPSRAFQLRSGEKSRFRKQVSQIVRQGLRSRNQSPEELARRAGVAPIVVRRALAGEYENRTPGLDQLLQCIGKLLQEAS